MELRDVFDVLRDAVQVLHSQSVKFVETPVDADGNELDETTTTMDLGTFVIRSFGESLMERAGKTKEEIEDALGGGEPDEIPTGNPWSVKMSRVGGKTRKTKKGGRR